MVNELTEFKCPNCGGKLEFDAATQKMKCPYCEGTFDPELFDEGIDFTVENETWNDDDLHVYTCHSCGGTIVADENTAASSCPYCGNPVVISGNVSGIYKPKRVIPFRYDKEAAKNCYRKFIQGKTLLPKAFRNEATIDEIKGIYVPYWLFDGKVNASVWFDATKHRHWIEGDYDCTETRYYKVFRSGSVLFEDVPVDASSKITDDLTESIEPFDMSQIKDFNENYLAGFYADKYDVDAEASRGIANQRIANSARSLFASTVSAYDSCVPSSSSISIRQGKQEYVMYPVWLLNVKYKDKIYRFAMNGQTGKFVGDLPSDNGKLASIMSGVFIGVAALLSLIQYVVYAMR